MSNAAEDRVPPFVFVADSELEVANTLAAILNENGYEAVAFSSGEQLVEAATVIKPHVVMSAVSMQGMTGTEAALQIRRSIPECKVVLWAAPDSADKRLRRIASAHRFVILPRLAETSTLLRCLDRITSLAAA